MRLYDQAVEAAQAGGFLQWEALANERAHRFWLACANEPLALVYWQQAYACYHRWGAGAKVAMMETAYRTHLAVAFPTAEVSEKPAENQEQDTQDALLQRQIQQLRHYASQMQQDKLRREATTQAVELAQATQRLRVEVAERKRTEDALRKSEERYALTMDALNDGLWDWNVPSGNAFFSPNLYSLLGYAAGEFPANYASWRCLVHPEDLPRVEEELRLSINHGKAFAVDLRMKLKSGLWYWVSTRGRVMERDAEGKALRMVGTLSDITERKLAEAERSQLIQDLQSALASVKSLRGLLPICSGCKQIRDDQGYWTQVESYIQRHSEATFTHGMCPDCIKKYFPELENHGLDSSLKKLP
jgi:PAS domain S-box-containing protein